MTPSNIQQEVEALANTTYKSYDLSFRYILAMEEFKIRNDERKHSEILEALKELKEVLENNKSNH
ncbi:MAG: hypothetical protein SFY32_14075 [Bacteroidota bacterium]|nr:hypothetical protein [Bacteroidota bacterium]